MMSKSVRILHALRRNAGLSKTQLARTLHISPATTGVLVSNLSETGLVVSVGWNESKVGRRSERLALSEDGPYVLGVDLSESEIRFGVLNLAGEVLSRASAGFTRANGRVDEYAVADAVAEQVESLPTPVNEIGLAVPGVLDQERQVIRQAVNLGWRDVPLQPLLQARLSVPVTMDQHLKAALLAEEWWGAAQLADPAVLLMLGSGVGVALKIAGAPVTGASGTAGEIGHVPLSMDGPPCACGQRGCFEVYASATALRARYQTLKHRHGDDRDVASATVAQIAEAARAGEEPAREALDDHARYLGIGVVMLTNIVNPQVLILGDEVMEAADPLLPKVRTFVARHALPNAAAVDIKPSSFNGEGSLIGAATVAMDRLFQSAAANR